jgi:hypothetical protein
MRLRHGNHRSDISSRRAKLGMVARASAGTHGTAGHEEILFVTLFA